MWLGLHARTHRCLPCLCHTPHPPRRTLQVEAGSKIRFGRVLALKQDGKFTVGAPYLEGAAVEAEVLEELKGPKVGGGWAGRADGWMGGGTSDD